MKKKQYLQKSFGHYYCNALYDYNYTKEEINKREFRATKWAFKTLIPYSKLKELVNKGYKYYYEVAEELGVMEELVEKAYNYYSEGNYG